MGGPRDAWGLTGPGEWVEAVASGRIAPETVADALAVAFTRAMLAVMGDPERLAMQAGEPSSGEGRAALVQWGRELGMGRETLRQTVVGQRWVRLEEVDRANLHPVLRPVLDRHLAECLPVALRVLHTTQESGLGTGLDGTRGEGWVPAEQPETIHRRSPMPEPLDVLEARVRADLRALDRRITAERRAGRAPRDSTDWTAVRRLLGVPRAVAPAHPGMAAAARAAGVPSLADLVRDILRDGSVWPSYRIKREVQQAVATLQRQQGIESTSAQISGEQVDSTLGRLKRRGEVEQVGRGRYRATPTMKGATPTP